MKFNYRHNLGNIRDITTLDFTFEDEIKFSSNIQKQLF